MSAIKFQRTKTITKPGFYRMTREAYHSDMAPTPSLSSGLARTIVNASVAHALEKSPRHTGRAMTPTNAMDHGSAVHAFLAGLDADVEVIPFHDWKSGDAKRLRALAWRNGKTPILKPDVDRLRACADAVRPFICELVGAPPKDWLTEVAMFWRGKGVGGSGGWRRGCLDIVSPCARIAVDLKSTEYDASPRSAGRALYDGDSHIQEAHYLEGLDTLLPEDAGRRRFYFAFIERSEPFGVTIQETDGEAKAVAREAIALAGEEWDRAVYAIAAGGTGAPLAYPPGPHVADFPTWKSAAWFDRKASAKGSMQ